MSNDETPTLTGRLRKGSVSIAGKVVNFNPQPGMWAATGTAIAHAPTLDELREPIAGGQNIKFNAHGHSSRTVTKDDSGDHILSTNVLKPPALITPTDEEERPTFERRQTLAQQAESEERHGWAEVTKNGLKAAWKFVTTPTGFLMTIYGLNIVAWGAMLFFLLLGAAPAMNHPSKDAINSPRKIWIEIDSQILNALFCVTGYGLAPWRFRDLWWLIRAHSSQNNYAMKRLYAQNKAWFRPPAWYQDDESIGSSSNQRVTFTGKVAPPTSFWKLAFVVWMMILNTLFQVVLGVMMWVYNRIDRPSWSTGTFIALGCGSSLLAGIMMWWEGRKVKFIEGPVISVVENKEINGVKV